VDGKPPQAPRIPSERDYTEVSTVVASPEACTAEVADRGGAEGNGSQAEGATGLDKSAATPVIARPDFHLGGRVMKAAVHSHPGLMRAHQTGSITDTDHKAVHGAEKCEPLAKPGSNLPKGGEGVDEALDESTVGQSPASEGPTMPNVTKAEATDETLWAEATSNVRKAEFQAPIVKGRPQVSLNVPVRSTRGSGIFVNGQSIGVGGGPVTSR